MPRVVTLWRATQTCGIPFPRSVRHGTADSETDSEGAQLSVLTRRRSYKGALFEIRPRSPRVLRAVLRSPSLSDS